MPQLSPLQYELAVRLHHALNLSPGTPLWRPPLAQHSLLPGAFIFLDRYNDLNWFGLHYD